MPEIEPAEIPTMDVGEYGTSTLHVGIEVEYPTTEGHQPTTLTQMGRHSSDLKREWRDTHGGDWVVGGNMTGDATVGAEIVSEVLDIHNADEWYRDTIEEAESFGYPHEPVGDMADSADRTAGLHIHLSALTDEQARALQTMSQQPWMQAFVCTTLWDEGSDRNLSVFRGGQYCDLSAFNSGRYSVVHAVNSASGHYEWRMPEPMTADNFELLVEFLNRFSEDVQDAAQFARDVVYNARDELTSFDRADAIGLDLSPDEPEEDHLDGSVSRMPHIETTEFFNLVRDAPNAPYIYRVDVHGEGTFYTFESHSNAEDDEFHEPESGLRFSPGDVLRADSLEEVTRDSLRENVRELLNQPIEVDRSDDEDEPSEAAELIHEIRSA